MDIDVFKERLEDVEKKFGKDPRFALQQIISAMNYLHDGEIDEYEVLDLISRILSNYQSEWRRN